MVDTNEGEIWILRRALIGLAAASIVVVYSLQAVAASTSNSNYNQRTMLIGSYTAHVKGIVAKDSGHLTEFLPIFYLKTGLNTLGYQTTWNGTNGAFQITTPTGSTQNLTKVTAKKGDMTFYVNGVPVANAPKPIVAKDPVSGVNTSYVAIYYLSEVLMQMGFTTAYSGTTHTWQVTPPPVVPVDLSLTGTPQQQIAAGTYVGFGLTNNGTPVTSGVTWSATGGVIDQNGNFTATAGGTYKVSAEYDGHSVTASVSVYGPPASVQVKAASSTLVADNQATDAITVTVEDAKGNRVFDYTGSVVLQTTTGTLAPATVLIQNGVGTTRLSTDTAAQTDTVSAIALNDANGTPYTGSVSFGRVEVLAESPKPMALWLSPNTTPSSSTSHVLTVSVLDQAGNELKNAPSTSVTFMLSGPGVFTNGSSMMSQYVTDGTSLVVYSEAGVSGPITVTAAAPGLDSGSTTLDITQTP